MHKIFGMVILAVALAAGQTPAQTQPTAAELLQKGIYAQETAGDLDGAIKIYRQIVDSHPIQREIAAQAQYRLGMTLLDKGDAAAASQEIQRLGWDFPDYKELIASAKAASGTLKTFALYARPADPAANHAEKFYVANGEVFVAANHDAEFDFTKSVTVTGTVTQVQFMNPISWLTLNPPSDGAPAYRVSLASPNTLSQGGWQRATAKPGDQIIVTGAPALDGTSTMQATSVSANGAVIFTRSPTATK
jgi:hypothetical protein